MSASNTKPGLFHATPWNIGLAALVAASCIGAALYPRGSDPVFQPEMVQSKLAASEGRALYVQRFEVSLSEWKACVDAGGCSLSLKARPGQDPARTPATGMNYFEAQEFVSWVNHETGKAYRMPTNSEWTALAEPVLPEAAAPLFDDPALDWASAYLIEDLAPRALKAQGSFSVSPDGIADLDGSVWEWTQSCFDDGFADRCPAYWVGGEHIAAIPFLVGDPARGGCAVGTPPAHLGLRLVSEQTHS